MAKTDPPIYHVENLRQMYAGRTVLAVDRLTVAPAAIVGLMGPNGSGKSTLLKLLGLIEKPTHGSIQFNGQPVSPFADQARFHISLLPQEPFLMKRSVFSNVAYGLKLKGGAGDIAPKVERALSLVGFADKAFAKRPWYALSGGETQRVALAARLVLEPKILLLDEPTANVDMLSARLIRDAALRARRELGTTLVIASHDRHWLNEVCDEVWQLFRGRVVGAGSKSIVIGPFKALGSGKWGRVLPDGQIFQVPPPPAPQAAALIDIAAVTDASVPLASHMTGLHGVISQLNLQGRDKRIFVTIHISDLHLNLHLTTDKMQQLALFPGKPVFIRYDLDQVQWID